MHYKLFISTAGLGKRLGANEINKSLLPINKEAIISKIINKFPINIKIIIALGYQGSLVKEFIKLSHPERKIKFVSIKNFSGLGSGPGLTLKQCKKYLQCPFIYSSCDTLTKEKPLKPSFNWIGTSSVSNTESFLIIEKNKTKLNLFDKKNKNQINKNKKKFNAFIGLMGIKDYKKFWEDLENNHTLIQNELQVSNGLKSILQNIKIKKFTWYDTGTKSNYQKTLNHFKDNTLRKNDEYIYVSKNNKVIKYFKNKSKVERIKKRSRFLIPFVPKILNTSNNFFAYKYEKGKLLSQINEKKFIYFLRTMNNNFWLNEQKKISKLNFTKICKDFYKKKKMNRVKLFLKKSKINDEVNIINGIKVPRLSEILKKLNWFKICDGIPINFHGDLQPENIILNNEKIKFIDWRDNFGGNIKFGDIYYEFSKLDHALIINGEKIRKKKYEIKVDNEKINYNFQKNKKLLKFRKIFYSFLQDNNYDTDKVKLLSNLIYLNIAPLHDWPYSDLLYYHGKLNLFKYLKNNEN